MTAARKQPTRIPMGGVDKCLLCRWQGRPDEPHGCPRYMDSAAKISKLGLVSPSSGAPPSKGERLPQTSPRQDGGIEPNTLGSTSSIPAPPSQWGKSLMPCRGGDADPNILRSAYLIRDPVLRAAFLRAYRAWERAQ